jgi:hypothetical protein
MAEQAEGRARSRPVVATALKILKWSVIIPAALLGLAVIAGFLWLFYHCATTMLAIFAVAGTVGLVGLAVKRLLRHMRRRVAGQERRESKIA